MEEEMGAVDFGILFQLQQNLADLNASGYMKEFE